MTARLVNGQPCPESSLARWLPGRGKNTVGDTHEGSPERRRARHEKLPIGRDERSQDRSINKIKWLSMHLHLLIVSFKSGGGRGGRESDNLFFFDKSK